MDKSSSAVVIGVILIDNYLAHAKAATFSPPLEASIYEFIAPHALPHALFGHVGWITLHENNHRSIEASTAVVHDSILTLLLQVRICEVIPRSVGRNTLFLNTLEPAILRGGQITSTFKPARDRLNERNVSSGQKPLPALSILNLADPLLIRFNRRNSVIPRNRGRISGIGRSERTTIVRHDFLQPFECTLSTLYRQRESFCKIFIIPLDKLYFTITA